MSSEIFLTPKELSERWKGRVKVLTLQDWRRLGKGPTFTQLGGKNGHVLYPLSAVEAYEEKHTKNGEPPKED